jgi:hypothetical protein
MIDRVREIASRLLLGVALVVAVVAAIGYVFIFLATATPVGAPLATLPKPAAGAVIATRLDDGRPVYLVGTDGGARVLDARAPVEPGAVPPLVAWCEDAEAFLDLVHGGTFSVAGEVMGESARVGLEVYPTEARGDEVIVRDAAAPAPTAPGDTVALDCREGSAWEIHAPTADEIFDPTVAADTEPPGWIWIEGTLAAAEDEVRLCDGLDGSCASGAAVVGIDPAKVQPTAGRFLGRIVDGAVRNLVIVPSIPDSGESS